MKKTSLHLLAICVVVALLFPTSGYASHYPLEAVPFIAAKDTADLKKAGVADTEQLLQQLATPAARKSMRKKTRIAKESLLEYARLCDLLSIRGVGPKMGRLLRLAGVEGVTHLRTHDAVELLKKMKEANNIHTISEILPGHETVADWILQAKKIKTPLKP